MHISTVFYSGLEGIGGLEMQTKPVPQVRSTPRSVCRNHVLINPIPRVLTVQSHLPVPLRTWVTLRFAYRTIPKTFMLTRRPSSTTLSEEQASLATESTEETSGKRKVTRNQPINLVDANFDPQRTSRVTSSLERARSWNLPALRNIGARFPALLSVYRSQTAFSREVTSMPSRKCSKDPSSSTCSMRVQARTTSSTV